MSKQEYWFVRYSLNGKWYSATTEDFKWAFDDIEKAREVRDAHKQNADIDEIVIYHKIVTTEEVE